MALYSLDASSLRGSFADSSFNLSFFERNNKTASFPEGVGVISDEMVRFVLTWPVAGLEMPEASAQLTYKFNAQGQLIRMEYLPLYDTSGSISFLEILDTSAEEIDAKILSYTQDLIVDSFSWQEAQAKYTDADFNIRQDGFANNGGSSITSPVDAAKLALKEYPDLPQLSGFRRVPGSKSRHVESHHPGLYRLPIHLFLPGRLPHQRRPNQTPGLRRPPVF